LRGLALRTERAAGLVTGRWPLFISIVVLISMAI
jgi:hypothetical protein